MQIANKRCLYAILLVAVAIASVCSGLGSWNLLALFCGVASLRILLELTGRPRKSGNAFHLEFSSASDTDTHRIANPLLLSSSWSARHMRFMIAGVLIVMGIVDVMTGEGNALERVLRAAAWSGVVLLIFVEFEQAGVTSLYWLSLIVLAGSAFLPRNPLYLPLLMVHAVASIKFFALAGLWTGEQRLRISGSDARSKNVSVKPDGPIRRSYQLRKPSETSSATSKVLREDSLSEFFLLVLTLVLSGLMFVVVPRPGLLRGGDDITSGKSQANGVKEEGSDGTVGRDWQGDMDSADRLDLRGRGPDLSDRTLVMTVETKTDARGKSPLNGKPLRLRGAVLDAYAEGTWVSTSVKMAVRDGEDGTNDGWTTILDEASFGERMRLWQRVTVTEQARTRFIWGAPDIMRVKLPGLFVDHHGTVMPEETIEGLSYEVESLLPCLTRQIKEATISQRYLQIPADYDDVRALAVSWTTREQSAWEKARSIQRKLESGYVYTTEVSYGTIGDPIRRFLFSEKRGYCAHFAGAMAILLRCVGIPSRIAMGYLSSEYDAVNGTYMIRNCHAHAWAEGYIKGVGWLVFEPSQVVDGIAAVHETAMTNIAEADRSLGWQDIIWRFGSDFQAGLWEGIGRFASGIARFVWNMVSSPLIIGLLFAAVAVIISSLVLIPRDKREDVIKSVLRPMPPDRCGFYEEFLRTLSKRGFRKSRTQTGMEFASAVKERIPVMKTQVFELTELYYRVRYGGQAIDRECVEKASVLLQQIREALARQ